MRSFAGKKLLWSIYTYIYKIKILILFQGDTSQYLVNKLTHSRGKTAIHFLFKQSEQTHIKVSPFSEKCLLFLDCPIARAVSDTLRLFSQSWLKVYIFFENLIWRGGAYRPLPTNGNVNKQCQIVNNTHNFGKERTTWWVPPYDSGDEIAQTFQDQTHNVRWTVWTVLHELVPKLMRQRSNLRGTNWSRAAVSCMSEVRGYFVELGYSSCNMQCGNNEYFSWLEEHLSEMKLEKRKNKNKREKKNRRRLENISKMSLRKIIFLV